MSDNSSYENSIDRLCSLLKEEPEPELRIDIIIILQEIGNEKALDSIIEATKDEDRHVRKAALGAIRNSQINKLYFLSYIQKLFDSQENIQDILQRKDISGHIGRALFAFKERKVTIEKHSNVKQNYQGSVGIGIGNINRDLNFTGDINNFNYGTSSEQICQELEKIFDQIINKNLVAAQEAAQKAVKDRLPALLKNQQAIELAVSNNPKLTDRFKSAIKAVGIEKVRSIFTLADIPIEGFNQWDKNDNSKN